MRTRLAARPLPRRDWDWETSCSNYVGLGPEPSSIGIILINCPNPGLRIFSTILISLGKVCPFQVPYVFRESSPVPFKNRMCIMNGPSAMKRQGAGLVARRKVPPTIQYISPLALKRSVDCPFRLAVEDVAKFSHRKRGPCVQVSCPSRDPGCHCAISRNAEIWMMSNTLQERINHQWRRRFRRMKRPDTRGRSPSFQTTRTLLPHRPQVHISSRITSIQVEDPRRPPFLVPSPS